MSRVYVKFPKTGLGNLLLIWARAAVFAELNQLPLVTSPWWGIRWGAWKRGEKKKRFYWGYFQESSVFARLSIIWFRSFSSLVLEPSLKRLSQEECSGKLFVFKDVVVQNDLFAGLREHRDWIKDQLFNILNPKLKRQFVCYHSTEVAVHIRRGDFRYGNPITPLSFYIAAIESVRHAFKQCLHVTIFTDAEDHEIEVMLTLPNVKIAETKADILDILLMSQAKVVILSQSSTFSYWAAFLSDAIIIKPNTDWQQTIRKSGDNSEIPFDNSGQDGRQKLASSLNVLFRCELNNNAGQ